jgi:hypothetical protein
MAHQITPQDVVQLAINVFQLKTHMYLSTPREHMKH